MLRDNKQFRERFQRWKNGEQVYDSGRPIDSYEVGKDPVADAIYDQEVQQASRNNYIRWGFDSAEDAYRRIMNGQAPRPKFNDTITNDVVVDHYEGGKDAKSRLTNALIGMAVADNPAVMTASGWKQDKSGNWAQKRTKEDEQLGRNLAALSTMSPTHPLSAAIGGAINKLSNLARIRQAYGMQLNGIKLTKSGTQKLFDDLITGNITPEAMAYIPQGLQATTTKIPAEIYQSMANSTVPRLALHRPWLKEVDIARSIDNALFGSKYAEFYPEVYNAAGQSKFGGFYNPTKRFLSIKAGKTAPYARPHEVRHLVDDVLPMTESEENLVNRIFDSHFVDPEVEKITTIGDARRQLLGLDRDLKMHWKDQNRLIDRVSDDDIIEALEAANGYGKRYVSSLTDAYGHVPSDIVNALREGMKYLGVSTGVGLNVPTTFDARQYKNGKDGIYIKPANRGKFTALKKRTGHSASWFKAHGTPAQKKMATFALNSRKWHKN